MPTDLKSPEDARGAAIKLIAAICGLLLLAVVFFYATAFACSAPFIPQGTACYGFLILVRRMAGL